MSAAEKLKALDSWSKLAKIQPQIVAVVEAAEAVRLSQPMTNVDTIPIATMVSLRQATASALAALNEALQ